MCEVSSVLCDLKDLPSHHTSLLSVASRCLVYHWSTVFAFCHCVVVKCLFDRINCVWAEIGASPFLAMPGRSYHGYPEEVHTVQTGLDATVPGCWLFSYSIQLSPFSHAILLCRHCAVIGGMVGWSRAHSCIIINGSPPLMTL